MPGMRIYDALTVALLAAVLACVLARSGRWRTWSRVLLAAASITCVAHYMVERTRWQMWPVYLVLGAALVFAAVMYQPFVRRWVTIHESLRTRLGLAASVVGGILLGSSVLASWCFPLLELPLPSGRWTVGTRTFHWVDSTRLETRAQGLAGPRELMVRVWYPATANGAQSRAAYLENAKAIGHAINRRHWPYGYLLEHLELVPTHSLRDAPLAGGEQSYPILVFSHGLSLGYSAQNTVLIEELASHGYVVFAIDHAYDGLATVYPDGRVALFDAAAYEANDPRPSAELTNAEARLHDSLDPGALLELSRRAIQERPQEARMRRERYEAWSRDQRFVLDQIERLQAGEVSSPFAGHLQLQHLGVFGMSFGGVAAARTCALDSRCRAGINLDGFGDVAIENPPHQRPFLYFNHDGPSSNAVFMDLDRGPRYFIKVAGTEHLDFTDTPLLTPLAKLLGASGPIETGRMLELTSAYVRAFFDQYLRGELGSLLQGASADYPEVTFLARAAEPAITESNRE